jgi:hypothetical protein
METNTTSFNGVNPMKLQKVANSIPVLKTLKTDLKKTSIETFIFNEITKLPNYQTYKNDIAILIYACNLVENLISKRKKGETKEEIIINVFVKLFSLNADEINSLKKNIKSLVESKDIKKLSSIYSYSKQFGGYLLKKIC